MIKKFKEYNEGFFYNTKIKLLCKKYNIKNYSINPDLSIDVEGSVDLYNLKLSSLPLRFSRVGGGFFCQNNNLTTLEGGPREVRKNFNCHNNLLTTLDGSPREVGENFDCAFNNLTTLEGGPREVGRNFYCSFNHLTTLEGGPIEVGRDFDCSYNQLTTLDGGPREVVGDFYCFNNPIIKIVYKFPDRKKVLKFWDDFNIVRNGNEISAYRFKEMYLDLTGNEFKGYMEFEGYKVVV